MSLPPALERSSTEKLLVGQTIPSLGKSPIKGVLKHSAAIRIIETEDGKKLPVSTSRLKALTAVLLNQRHPGREQRLAQNPHKKTVSMFRSPHLPYVK